MNPTIITSATYDIDIGYNLFLIDCTANDVDIYLPEMLYNNIDLTIKRIDTSTNLCNLHVNQIDSTPVDNSVSIIVIDNYELIQIISCDNKWWILNRI